MDQGSCATGTPAPPLLQCGNQRYLVSNGAASYASSVAQETRAPACIGSDTAADSSRPRSGSSPTSTGSSPLAAIVHSQEAVGQTHQARRVLDTRAQRRPERLGARVVERAEDREPGAPGGGLREPEALGKGNGVQRPASSTATEPRDRRTRCFWVLGSIYAFRCGRVHVRSPKCGPRQHGRRRQRPRSAGQRTARTNGGCRSREPPELIPTEAGSSGS